jgi:2-keto-3-deoxy-L-rhamnonate aldolase RhmA
VDAFHHVIAAAKANGKFSGVHFGASAWMKKWLSSGMTMNMCSSDVGMLAMGAGSVLGALREE